MRTQLALLVVGVLVVASFVAGCGDSSGSDTAVTKQGFLKEADAVCAKQKQKIDASVQSSDSIKASEESAEGGLPALAVEVRQIEAIGIPSGDESEVEAMLKNVNKTLDLAGEGEARNRDLIKASEYLALAEKQAGDYGLKVCFFG